MNISYLPSESKTVQGKENEVFRKYGKDYYIRDLGKGNGNYLLTKQSDVLIDGKSYRDFVLDHYGRDKLTRKLAEKFINDLEQGKVKI